MVKYSNYTIGFSFNLAIKLPKNTRINEYVIELIDDKPASYIFIYILSLMELKILKIYIKIYLKTKFICSLEFLIDAPRLFDKNLDYDLYLCINYRVYNNLTIDN